MDHLAELTASHLVRFRKASYRMRVRSHQRESLQALLHQLDKLRNVLPLSTVRLVRRDAADWMARAAHQDAEDENQSRGWTVGAVFFRGVTEPNMPYLVPSGAFRAAKFTLEKRCAADRHFIRLGANQLSAVLQTGPRMPPLEDGSYHAISEVCSRNLYVVVHHDPDGGEHADTTPIFHVGEVYYYTPYSHRRVAVQSSWALDAVSDAVSRIGRRPPDDVDGAEWHNGTGVANVQFDPDVDDTALLCVRGPAVVLHALDPHCPELADRRWTLLASLVCHEVNIDVAGDDEQSSSQDSILGCDEDNDDPTFRAVMAHERWIESGIVEYLEAAVHERLLGVQKHDCIWHPLPVTTTDNGGAPWYVALGPCWRHHLHQVGERRFEVDSIHLPSLGVTTPLMSFTRAQLTRHVYHDKMLLFTQQKPQGQ